MPIGGISYALQSVYLHSASEHAIAGQKFDMEMQFLHIAIVNGVQRFMVVSVFGRLSTQSAPFLATLASSLPTGFTTAEPVIGINLAEIAEQVLGQVI
jgi:carbonic anhydrase